MFLFKLFDVFSADYWNGFADGAGCVVLIYFIRAVFVHGMECRRFLVKFRSFCRRADNGALDVPAVETFIDHVENGWFLNDALSQEILNHVDSVLEFVIMRSQSLAVSKREAVASLRKIAEEKRLAPSRLFLNDPVHTICQSLCRAAWFR